MINVKRVYDDYEESDGYRILVDRLWPRGISKARAKIDEWVKEIGPSDELRKWFAHDETRWPEFKRLYFKELKEKELLVHNIIEKQSKNKVTFIYAAKDEMDNNAVALKEYIENIESGGE